MLADWPLFKNQLQSLFMRQENVLIQGWILSCPGFSPGKWNLLKYEKPLVNTKGREMEILPVTEHFNLKQNEINLKKEKLSFSVKGTKVRIVKLGSRLRWKQL